MPGSRVPEKSFEPVIVGVGVDLVDLDRIERLLDEQGERFLRRVFTPAEQRYCMAKVRPVPSLAARFAAKEAVMKCLGTGWAEGVGFTQIEVVVDSRGQPHLELTGQARAQADRLGIAALRLSMSHAGQAAVAFVVASGRA